MQYGHGSLISVVVLAGVFLIRYLGSQRRRGGPPVGSRGPRSQFTTTDPRAAAPPPTAEPPTTGGSGGLPAGWFRDPFVRHEQRFWSGTEWTDHVLDDGVPSTDPPPTPSGSGDPA